MSRRPPSVASPEGARRARRRVGRALWPVLASLALILVLFTAVFPTRTFLAQRRETGAAEQRLAVLREENAGLEQRAAELRDDEEIEQLARERYNLVRPGEEAYALLPAPTTTTTAPPDDEGDEDRNPVEQLWDGVTGLL